MASDAGEFLERVLLRLWKINPSETLYRRAPAQSSRYQLPFYDALVVALGSVTDFRAVPGMAEHALGVRTLGDAFYLRNRALAMLEEAAAEPDPSRCRQLLTFVVVGGGSTGVEVAAELHDLDRLVLDRILVVMPPERPEWHAIRDRLQRATRVP